MGNITHGGQPYLGDFSLFVIHGVGGPMGGLYGAHRSHGNQGKQWMTLWVQLFGFFDNIFAFFTREIIKFFYCNGNMVNPVLSMFFIDFG